MSFLAPAFLVAAAAVATVVVALHFIVTREPKTTPLPTARFVPDRPVRAQSRAIRLQDVLLLALRVALVLAVGVALAKPVLEPSRQSVRRILVVDRSRAVGVFSDSIRALLNDGDALILFDSAATLLTHGTRDSVEGLKRSEARGSLSAALVVALRAAAMLRDAADSLELVIASPLVEEEFDAATDSIRALWPGRIRLVAVAPRPPIPPSAVGLVARADDPIRFALPEYRSATADEAVRLVRGSLGSDDSSWVSAGPHALVHWPEADPTITTPVVSAVAGIPIDTVGAVVAGNTVVAAPFIRANRLDRDSAASDRVVARWVDGEPAAVERSVGAGCVRRVHIPVPSRGDLVLQPRFAALVRALTEPCGGLANFSPVSNAKRAALVGTEASPQVARESIAPTRERTSPLSRWFLLLAVALAVAEWVVRQRVGRGEERTP